MTLYKRGSLAAALETLGIPELRQWQEAPLAAILDGDDVLVVQSTAGGKSLLFQVPAIMDERGVTLVISPLRALQVDQVRTLLEKGIPAAVLNSDLSKTERKELLNHLSSIRLLYLAPEQLWSEDLAKALKRCVVNRLVVDEAHILPEAESSFRKAYGRIGEFLDTLPERPQVYACTATATPKVQKRILKALHMEEAKKFIYPVRRHNLRITAKHVDGKGGELEKNLFHAVERVLQQWNGKGSAVVYCPTVRRVKVLSKWLKGRNWEVAKYTGKMKQKKRQAVQEEFLSGTTKIVVATNAFGLGIDKRDVKLVIHAGLPLSLSGYVQEIGRAGRNGKKATCILFYSKADVKKNEQILLSSGQEEAKYKLNELYALQKLVTSKKCIWKGIEKHFGQKVNGACGHCCHCKAKKL